MHFLSDDNKKTLDFFFSFFPMILLNLTFSICKPLILSSTVVCALTPRHLILQEIMLIILDIPRYTLISMTPHTCDPHCLPEILCLISSFFSIFFSLLRDWKEMGKGVVIIAQAYYPYKGFSWMGWDLKINQWFDLLLASTSSLYLMLFAKCFWKWNWAINALRKFWKVKIVCGDW